MGNFAVQLAADFGAEVLAVVRPREQAALLELGASRVLDAEGDSAQVARSHPAGGVHGKLVLVP